MTYAEGMATLERRGRFATIGLWLFALLAVPAAGGELLEAVGAVNLAVDSGPLAVAVGLAYLAYAAAFFGTVVLVALWLHRAHANLHAAGTTGLEFTPGWAVGWYFVPFANLVMPFKAMRELWNASHGRHDPFGGTAPGVVKAWWAAWIGGNILESVGSRILSMEDAGSDALAAGSALGAAGTAGTFVAAVLLIRIIGVVTGAQRTGGSAVAVFA